MIRKSVFLLGLGLVAAFGIASPAYAAPGGQILEVVAIRKAAFIQIWESVQVPSRAPHVFHVDVPANAEDIRLGGRGKIIEITEGDVRIQSAVPHVILLYHLPPAQPLVWYETFRQKVTSAVLMFGPGIYPSGLAAAPFRYVTNTMIGGTRLKVFSATNLPPGQSILWPMTLGHPDQLVADAFTAALVVVPLAGLAWGWLRLRNQSAPMGRKSVGQKAG